MKGINTRKTITILVFIIEFSCSRPTDKQPNNLWQTTLEQGLVSEKEIEEGIVWRYYHYDTLTDSCQSINVVEIDLEIGSWVVDVAYSDSILYTIDHFAEASKAIVALNGTFFDMENGGSSEYTRVNSQTVNKTVVGKYETFRDEAGIAKSSSGETTIVHRIHDWNNAIQYEDVLAGGPLLLYENQKNLFVQDSFNLVRHPRSALGIDKDGKLLMVTVDGRTEQAVGMSIEELADLMVALGCKSAVNMDGGGSSTLWIKGKGNDGVVNFPSDNKKYDHKGLRPMANAIVIKKD